MKPSFALQFTDTGITLLHRTGRGWLPLGDAAIDDPALGENLGYLRATALGLEPQGITSKLVIPNDQILYTRVDAPGPEAGKRRNQIRRALEGRTPYGVDELVFDWSGTGPEVMVAVIARDTLAEAEAFAASHRFNPMSFVALPDPAQFDGEPFFGPQCPCRYSTQRRRQGRARPRRHADHRPRRSRACRRGQRGAGGPGSAAARSGTGFATGGGGFGSRPGRGDAPGGGRTRRAGSRSRC